MHLLEPVVFTDDWGSHISIASLMGRPIPSPEPESEVWFGAHEAGPCPVIGGPGHTLADLIASDATRLLGPECVERFGARLPFLLKVLAPGKAISIQAHPSAAQARARRAVPGDRTYVDDWAKPELLLALSPFEIFAGLRSRDEIEEFAARLDVPAFSAAVSAAATDADPVRGALERLLRTPPSEVGELVRDVVAACVRVEADGEPFGPAAAGIVSVAEDHPDDIGIAVLALMRYRTLQPGDYVDVPAGVLHSYVRGLGLEVLANSDNVVRAGLTHKPVDVEELLRIVDTAAQPGLGRHDALRAGVDQFPSQSDRFALHRVDPTRCNDLPGAGSPRLAFVLRGEVDIRAAGIEHRLSGVGAGFIPAGEEAVVAGGDGELFVVSVPELRTP